ncbi:MAG: tetratricopeptide repeat protein [Bacteroidetes bacterium CHB6]|nr:tetratricopeptide repeat protein [Bacteroidetes bacterium CHB6]
MAVTKMKKLSCSSILLFLSFLIATAQSNKELKSVFESSNVSLFPRPFYYEGSSVTKLLSSEEQMLQQAQSKNVNNDILIHANNAGYYCLLSGDLIQAIKYFLLASNTYTNDDSKALLIKAHLAFANDIGCRDSQALRLYSELLESATFSKLNLKLQAYINGLAGVIYLQERDSARAIKVLNISEKQLLAEKLFKSLADLSEREGEIYLAFNKYKEALVKYNQQLKYTDASGAAIANRNIGMVYFKKGEYERAETYFRKSLSLNKNDLVEKLLKDTYLKIVTVSSFNHDFDKADRYHELYRALKKVETVSNETPRQKAEKDKIISLLSAQSADQVNVLTRQEYELSQQLTALDIERQNKEKALEELTLAEAQKKLKELELEKVSSEKLRQEAELTKKELQLNKQKEFRNILLFVAGIVVVGLFFLYSRYRLKKQSLTELNKAHEELRLAHDKLKQTQDQLIQSEKMASLGQLTAGIAHEIQNPLNFVTNFSATTQELIQEYKEDKDATILDDISSNLDRIQHHGQRVSAIVKGMLLHSRSNSSEREKVSFNQLVEDSLSLAYHGKRSTDADFHCNIIKQFSKDTTISVMTQDVRRVLINLFNNAFYAVMEKEKLHKKNGDAATVSYLPQIVVTTKSDNDFVELIVSDNGTGIPDEVKDKIFNPFFTSKPTGEGTGLGLSVSYDIIKQHGGKIHAESIFGDGTSFHIYLPLNHSTKENNNAISKDIQSA